jgi:hypothetical protein
MTLAPQQQHGDVQKKTSSELAFTQNSNQYDQQ